MTVEIQTSKAHYQGNGLTTEWPLPFPLIRAEHLRIVVTDIDGADEEITTDYEVHGVNTESVSVTYPLSGTPLAAGCLITFYRDMPLTQTLDLESGGAFDAEVLERQGFDRLVMQIQQVQEQASRALRLAITDVDRTPDEVLGEMFELRDAAQQALTSAQQALQTAQEASQTANQASQATQDAIVQVEQTLQETVQTVQDAQQALQDMDALMQEVETLAESLEGLGNLGEILQEVQTALGEVQDALTALNALGPGTATVSGFTPVAPEGWEDGWALTLTADGSTTYSAPPEIPEVPLAAAPSEGHPDGVAGLVVPDGETVQIENGLLKSSGGGFFPGQIVYSSTNTLPDGDKFIFIDGVDGQPGLLPRAAYQGFINNWLSRPENAALWVADSVWQAEVSTFGFTLKYSKGDGSTTWRPPFLQECFIGAAGVNRPMGSAELDKIQNITGYIRTNSSALTTGGVFSDGSTTSGYHPYDPTQFVSMKTAIFDASTQVRTGDRVEPRSVYARVMLCVANTTINASEQNIQALVDTLAHKLDNADYAANNTYSTSEVNTGKKWIDGKTIYRKVVATGALPNNTTKTVAHNITNVSGFVQLYGNAYRPDTNVTIPLPHAHPTASSAVLLSVDPTNISLLTGANLTVFSTSYVTLEYTKKS